MVLSSYVKLAECVFYVVLLQIETHKRAIAYDCATSLVQKYFGDVFGIEIKQTGFSIFFGKRQNS